MPKSTNPSTSPASKDLPLEIHAATRPYHTSLNRLIISRLPLCLPPLAQDASGYLCGIRAFAEIYFTFESQWISLISSVETTEVSPRIQNLLGTLYHPSLIRTTRLKHDLAVLSHRQCNLKRLNLPSWTTLSSYISTRSQSSPHILLAYSWVMYLALFNGGRWIRSQLLFPNRGTSPSSSQFWPAVSPNAEAGCLTFWQFDGDQDGTDVKTIFKSRFETLAAELTDLERQDVVEEAVEIFKICVGIVEELDVAFAADPGYA